MIIKLMIVEMVITFLMMSHHHQINDAVIIELMIVEKKNLSGAQAWTSKFRSPWLISFKSEIIFHFISGKKVALRKHAV